MKYSYKHMGKNPLKALGDPEEKPTKPTFAERQQMKRDFEGQFGERKFGQVYVFSESGDSVSRKNLLAGLPKRNKKDKEKTVKYKVPKGDKVKGLYLDGKGNNLSTRKHNKRTKQLHWKNR